MHLNYPDGEYRHGAAAAASFNQLSLPQSPDFDALKGDEKVWAVFDLSLSNVRKQVSDRPEWTAVYYPALVSHNQVSVRPQCKRVIYCDATDNGKWAIVPAEAHVTGTRFPGLVQVSRSELSAGVGLWRPCNWTPGAVVLIADPRPPPNCVRRCD